MATAAVVTSQTLLERGEALKKGGNAHRQKYTRLFYTDATGKITAFTIRLFEKTATGINGKQLAYTREQWDEIVKEKTNEMKLAATQAAGGNTAAPDLFTGIAGFESSSDETDGVTYSIPTTTPASSGSPTLSPRIITIPSSTDRARNFNTLAQAMDPRDASLLSDSPRVPTSQSQRASLPDWWDSTMTEKLTKEQIDAVLAAPSIGIKNDDSGNTCFINTMFNAFILHDRELIDALLLHRKEEPTKQIAMYLYNYIKYRTQNPNDLLSFKNTEQFRNSLNQIDPARGYLTGQHDACQAYLSLRAAVVDKKWLPKETCTATQRTYYQAPKPTDRFHTGFQKRPRPVRRTAMEILRREPQKAPVDTEYDLHRDLSENPNEAFNTGLPDTQSSLISINLSQKSKSPLALETLVQDQYFSVRMPANSETVLQPIITEEVTVDNTVTTKSDLQDCKPLRQTRLLSGEPPKILIFEFDGSGEVTIPAKYTLSSAYRDKVGGDKPPVEYALKSASIRKGSPPPGGGHYYSYDKRGTQWYCTNDSVATPIEENTMLAELLKQRRSLVYERINSPAPAVVL